jgi:hypothetical protein
MDEAGKYVDRQDASDVATSVFSGVRLKFPYIPGRVSQRNRRPRLERFAMDGKQRSTLMNPGLSLLPE